MGRKMGEKRDREREREKAIDSKLKSSQTSSSSSLSPSLIVRRREMHEHTKEPQHNFPRDRCVCVGRDDTMAGAHYRQPRPFASLGGGLWLLVLLSFFLFFYSSGRIHLFPFPSGRNCFPYLRQIQMLRRSLSPAIVCKCKASRASLID